MSEGHRQAAEYPVAVVWSEALIVRQRIGSRRNADAAVMQMVIASVISEKAGKKLPKLLKRLEESE